MTEKQGQAQNDVEVELRRTLSLFDITMIGIGAMIGAGIFVLTGSAVGVAGPAAAIAFTINGVVALLTGMTYAELGSAFPEAGGGYLWAKEGLPEPSGFMSGWMSWVAHMIACSLYAVAFGSFLTWLFSEYGLITEGSLIEMVLVKLFAVAITIFFIYVNYSGVENTGKMEAGITTIKVIILAIFAGAAFITVGTHPGAMNNLTETFMPKGSNGIILAMGLTIIAFQGYEVIAQCGEEVKDPKKNIPKAIFLSIIAVTAIYVIVLVATLAAFQVPADAGINPDTGQAWAAWEYLGYHKETAMIESAQAIMGTAGLIIMIIGGFLATTSALNATIFSSSRVSFAMGRDGTLPKAFRRIHKKKQTPYKAVMFSGTIIMLFAVLLPIEQIAASADIMFLLLFTMANMSLIVLRYKRPDVDRGFKVPLFPWIPLVAICLNIFLALFIYTLPEGIGKIAWYIAGFCILTGLIIYFPKARDSIIPEDIALPTKKKEEEAGDERPVVMVALRNIDNTNKIRYAAKVAKSKGARLIILNIFEVPRGRPLSSVRYKDTSERIKALNELKKIGEEEGVDTTALVSISHNISTTIIDIVKERKIELLILGWKGQVDPAHKKIFGSSIDDMTQNAPCDVLVFRAHDIQKKAKHIGIISGRNWHGIEAAEIGISIARQNEGDLTVIMLEVDERLNEKDAVYAEKIMKRARELDLECLTRTIKVHDIASDIAEPTKDYDLLVMGASTQWTLKRYAFGPLEDSMVKAVECPIMILRKDAAPELTIHEEVQKEKPIDA